MFTKEEMDFTVKEMLRRSIELIEDFNEVKWSTDILNLLKHVVNDSQDAAKSYWATEADVFYNDLSEILKCLCNPLFKDFEIKERVFRKVLGNRYARN
jgi:hypothetical protein